MSVSIPNIAFILLTLLTWAGIHGKLTDKDVELFQSRIWMLELPPAVIFSFSFIYYLIPTGYRLITGNLPTYVTIGPFFPIMQFVGAVIFTVASVSWLSLLSDEQEEIEDIRKDVDSIIEDMDTFQSEIDIDDIDLPDDFEPFSVSVGETDETVDSEQANQS